VLPLPFSMLHDSVFERPEVFADAANMGILLIPAAEMRVEGADIILFERDQPGGRGVEKL